ncbi:MAG: serine/threonine-protein kinase [Lentisphaeria bacterium]|nr:serine/threonine-protein kinase [Lentisphaeria bacterium]
MTSSSQELKTLIAAAEEEIRKPGTMLFSHTRYMVDRVLGEGGMGITCLAYEISAGNLKRPVVLKFVKDSFNPIGVESFTNEVQLSILFNHPNLLPIYRLETETIRLEPRLFKGVKKRPYEQAVYFAVMQYIDGWNLRKIVDRFRSLNLSLQHDVCMYLVNRIARGLHYVHEYQDEDGERIGLVHRDVSPENVLIDRFGRVKVADFGIARPRKRLVSERGNQPGKLLYSSPEQLLGKTIDRRSDIYNVGLIMFFLFTGIDLFRPEMQVERARERIRAKMRRSPRPQLKAIDKRLVDICCACLEEDPGNRYQTCEDLATDIDIYFQETGKVVTSEILEEILRELFKDQPEFTSRRFIPLTGSPHLEQPGFNPDINQVAEADTGLLPTVQLDD